MFFKGITPNADHCCGCSACLQICPKDAISWIKDDNGFSFPKVNPDECIECGLCEKVCPFVNVDKVVFNKDADVYAAVSKNKDELSHSSSGGVFSAVADYILSQGGLVYGAAFDSRMQLCHIGISQKQDLYRLQGSKYLQSQNLNVYSEIKDNLNKGKLVYYVGTGCQVAGLKLFLRKEYANLLTSDILCHGTPPQRVFDAVVADLEKRYKGKVQKYLFRDKSVWGWSCSSSSSSIKVGNKIRYVGYDDIQDGYFNAFIQAANYRESCYVCPYAQRGRCGDITLADFWGVEKHIDIPNIRNGVSAIMINSPKGDEVLRTIGDKLKLYVSDIDDVQVINRTLIAPTPRPDSRDEFFLRFDADSDGTLKSFSSLKPKKHIVYLLKRNRFTSYLIKCLNRILKR